MAFAELQSAFYPSVYTGLVTTSDMMRLVAYGVLLLGIGAEQRADLRALRQAYTALDRLRVTEAERAALEERSRLAREIHDGLAQHLWFAKLKFERLASSVSEEERPLAGEVGQALDAAIVEARQALITMRTSLDADLPLAEMLTRTVDDFGLRSGLRRHLLGLDRAAHRAAATPADRAAAHRPGGAHQRPQARRRDRGAGPCRRPWSRHDGRHLRQRPRLRSGDGTATAAWGCRAWRSARDCWAARSVITSEPQGGTTIEVILPLLVPEWLPTIDPDAVTANPWLAQDDGPEVRTDDVPDTTSAPALVPAPDAHGLAAAAMTAACAGHDRSGGPARTATSRASTLRVMLVDDHALVRAAVRQAIDSDGVELVAEAATAEDAFALALSVRPDVLLLDIDLPGMSGIQMLEELAPRLPETKIVMLTVSDSERDMLDSIAAAPPAT